MIELLYGAETKMNVHILLVFKYVYSQVLLLWLLCLINEY